jgi:hypothetical protein
MPKTIVINERQFRMFSLNETKWNGNGEEFQLAKPYNIPPKLYHVSPKKYREQIMRNGLFADIGDEYGDWWNYEGPNGEEPDNEELPEMVFLTDNPYKWYNNLDEPENYDIWQIKTSYLDKNKLFLDPDSSMRNKGSYCYITDIEPSAIMLLAK